jgi:putative ABC transport system permease protein
VRTSDLIRFARDAASGSPLRTVLLVLAMAIGVAAVVVLTALGDGARRYVLREFSSIGSNLVIVLPGRSQTGGFNPGNAITSTPRDLTVDDAQALLRASAVHRVAPLAVGTSEISVGGKLREVMVAGTTAAVHRRAPPGPGARAFPATRRLATRCIRSGHWSQDTR